jgi:hypothetical protein
MQSMTRTMILSAAVLLCGTGHAAPIKVYILAGQSNALGGMSANSAPPPLNVSQASRLQYRLQFDANSGADSTGWEDLRPFAWGTELSFGKAMEQRIGEPVAIIKAAWTGTGLWRHWLPTINTPFDWGTPSASYPNLYQWMMAKVNTSLGQLGSLGYDPDVSGFLWVQGEGDSNLLDKALAYDENLAVLASTLRTDLGKPNLPFVFNQLHADLEKPGLYAYRDQLRESQRIADDLDPNMYMVNFDDLSLGPDSVHWTPTTHVEVGRRFADVFAPSGDFNDDGLVTAADLTAWKQSAGGSRVGDGNADGVADGRDFLLWQRQLGGAPAAAASVATIPEPGAAVLAGLGMLCLLRRRR